MIPPGDTSPPRTKSNFAETRWTLVLSAKVKDTPCAERALAELCQQYWPPLYAFARRRGFSVHDAQDHTQSFFARLLEKDILHSVAPEKGRFRTFMLVAFKRFLINALEQANTQRRGGGTSIVSMDVETAEQIYKTEPADTASAEVVYERRWALTLLDKTMQRLKDEYVAAGKGDEFEILKIFLTTEKGAANYDDAAAALKRTAGATRVAGHRLRRRYRELFREEIAQTVDRPDEIDDEVTHLLSVLTR